MTDRPLSPRLSETLDLLLAGLSYREIGARMGIQLGTVKQHVHDVLMTHGVRTRVELMATLMRRV